MTPLQFILILSGIIFLLFSIDAYQRKKLNLLHFIVFFGGIAVIMIFSFNVELLNKFWKFFGIARWADLLVYIWIIFLMYLYFELFNRINKNTFNTTRLITALALSKFQPEKLVKINKKSFKDNIIFLMRAYNEESVIWITIDKIIWAWFTKILVVNDGSRDNTDQIVNDKILKYPDTNIVLISHEINRGWGSANKTWFEFFKRYGDLLDIERVATFDSDGQMDIGDMPKFIEAAQTTDNDILLWSRFVKWWQAQNIPLMRKIILFGSKIITLFFNKIWVSDPHNGYRLIKLEALKQINIESDGMTYASELLDEVNRLNLKFAQIPVKIIYTQYSLKKWQQNLNAINILLELIYTKFFKR